LSNTGGALVSLKPDGTIEIKCKKLTIDGSVEFKGSSYTLNGKEAASINALTNGGQIIISKGW
jgi:phage gp45-like